MIIISEKGHYLGEKNHRQKMIDHLQNAGNLPGELQAKNNSGFYTRSEGAK